MTGRIQGFQRQSDRKRLVLPDSSGAEGGVARLAPFFLALGLGASGVVGSGWSVQPRGPVHWHWSVFNECARAHRWTDTCALQSVRTTTTTTTQAVSFKQVAFLEQLFRKQLWAVSHGGRQRCRRRHRQCPPPEEATTQTVPSARTSERRDGPVRA